jgi:hypothetical protein
MCDLSHVRGIVVLVLRKCETCCVTFAAVRAVGFSLRCIARFLGFGIAAGFDFVSCGPVWDHLSRVYGTRVIVNSSFCSLSIYLNTFPNRRLTSSIVFQSVWFSLGFGEVGARDLASS